MSIAERPVRHAPAEATSGELSRYSLFERLLHWEVGITFIALMLSGMALAYPRMAWLSGLFGGGQTMRAAHPWIGLAFTAGLLVMTVIWAKPMRFDASDRAWAKRLRQYAHTGHTGLDTGKWNAGQKGYFWQALIFGLVLLASGLPLWVTTMAGPGVRQLARLTHNVSYLVMVGGFIIHVLLSAFLFSGTMQAMTSGKVSKAWAAWHHPKWYREQTGSDPAPTAASKPSQPE